MWFESQRHKKTNSNSLPAQQTTPHNLPKKNNGTMIPPRLPASSGSSFEGKSNRSTMRDRAWSAQHGDAIFLRVTNLIFISFAIIL